MSNFDLGNEWALLQNQFDSYEKYSLIIKLFAVGVLTLCLSSEATGVFVLFLLLILWLQDAIWNTFQARIETRLLQLEEALALKQADRDSAVCQFNSQFLEKRPGTVGLVVEYFRQAVRPTVAFPHVALVVLCVIEAVVNPAV